MLHGTFPDSRPPSIAEQHFAEASSFPDLVSVRKSKHFAVYIA